MKNNEQLTNGQEANREVHPIKDNSGKLGTHQHRKMTMRISIGNQV